MDEIYSHAIYQHDPDIVSRSIGGETILVPIRQNVGDFESIYTLNETAARVWDLIDGRRSVAEVLEQILAEFEIDPNEANQDLTELLHNFLELGALEKL